MEKEKTVKDSFVYQLFSALKANQKSAIQKIIATKSRKEQIALWKAFVEGITDKEYLFLKIFKQKYQPNKDFLLRNELRILKTQIDKYLIDEQLEQINSNNQNEQNYLYVLGLLQIGELNLLKKVLPPFIEQCTESSDFHYAQLMTLNYIQVLELMPPKKSNLIEIHKLLENRQSYLNKAFLENTVLNNYIFEYTKHKSQEGDYPEKIAAIPDAIIENLEKDDTPILKYFSLMGQIKKLNGAEKITVLKEALSIIKFQSTKNNSFQFEYIKCISAVARELYISSFFEESLIYFLQYFELKKEKDFQFLGTLYNYCNALLKANQLEKIIPLINENETLIAQSSIEIYFKALRINIHLLRDLPIIFVIHFKIVQAWLFYKEGELDLALNELNNFNRAYKKMPDCKDYIYITNLFSKYFKLSIETKLIRDQKIQLLEKEVANFSANTNEALNHYSPLLWLQKELRN
jgi:hypothetical protein